jgi:hypothetical protein
VREREREKTRETKKKIKLSLIQKWFNIAQNSITFFSNAPAS